MLVAWLLALGSLGSDPAFVEGQRLYDQLEYEQAVFRFQEVALRPELPPEDRASALTWLGLGYAGAGSLDAARRSFVYAARAWPGVALPVEVSPALARLFDDAKREAATFPTAPLSPTPATAPSEPSTPPEKAGDFPVLPAAGLAAGATVAAAGVGMVVLSAVTFGAAQDKQLYQGDAKAQLDLANVELGVAYALIPIGLTVATASAWLLMGAGTP